MSDVPVIKPEWLVGITMTQAQKDQWLAALRSGDYHQCKGHLYKGGGYCCLGVLEKSVFEVDIPRGHYLRGERNILDADFSDNIQEILVALNDEEGWNFGRIADFIEANIPACDAVKP